MTTRYPCATCGRNQPADRLFLSRFTKNHYCNDTMACTARAVRRAVRVVAAREGQSVRRIDAVLAEREQSVELLRLG